jgi:DHA1 family tetracycline resistance protein-like MFS transporter
VFGRLSDRVGRRKILLMSLFGSGVSFVLFGLANTLWLLFAARIAGGIMDSTFSVAQAYVADITTGRDRLKQMGLMGAGIGLGFTVGPAIGGVLSTLYGYAAPSFLAAGLAFANFALAFVRLPESRPSAGPGRKAAGFRAFLRTVAAREQLVYLMVATFTGNFAFVFMDVTLAPWLQVGYGYGPLQAGLIFLYVSVVNVATQAAVLPRLSKRYSSASLLAIGLAVTTLSFLGFGLDGNMVFALAMGGLLMFGFGLVNPSLSHLISVNANEGDQGGVLGLSQSVGSLARVFAPSLAVSVFEFGVGSGFIGAAFLVAATINTIPLGIIVSRRRGLQTVPERPQAVPAERSEDADAVTAAAAPGEAP